MTTTNEQTAAPDASPSVEQRAPDMDVHDMSGADLEPIPTDSARKALNLIGWHLAKLRNLAVEHADITERYRAEIERIERAMNDRLAVIENETERRASLVQAAHLALYDIGAVDKTIHTPHGDSKLVEPKKPRIYAPDGAALDDLVPWADKHHPHIVKRSIGIADVRKVVRATDEGLVVDPKTGEVLVGLVAEIPRRTVSVKPAEGEAL